MKPKEDYDKLYSQKRTSPTSCPSCRTKLTQIRKAGTKTLDRICWNLGVCSLAVDLTKTPSWEPVPQS